MMMGGQHQLLLSQLFSVVTHSKSNPTVGGTIGRRENSKKLHRNIKNNNAPTLGTAKNTPTLFVNAP